MSVHGDQVEAGFSLKFDDGNRHFKAKLGRDVARLEASPGNSRRLSVAERAAVLAAVLGSRKPVKVSGHAVGEVIASVLGQMPLKPGATTASLASDGATESWMAELPREAFDNLQGVQVFEDHLVAEMCLLPFLPGYPSQILVFGEDGAFFFSVTGELLRELTESEREAAKASLHKQDEILLKDSVGKRVVQEKLESAPAGRFDWLWALGSST